MGSLIIYSLTESIFGRYFPLQGLWYCYHFTLVCYYYYIHSIMLFHILLLKVFLDASSHCEVCDICRFLEGPVNSPQGMARKHAFIITTN